MKTGMVNYLGVGGRAQNTYAHCKNTGRNQCNAAVYLNLCDFLKANLSADNLKKLWKTSISKKFQNKTQTSYTTNGMSCRKLFKPVLSFWFIGSFAQNIYWF
jgi:hypothetical protein